MPVAVEANFTDLTPEVYERIMDELEEDNTRGAVSHFIHPYGEGRPGMRIIEVWDSREHLDQFLQRALPVVQRMGLQPPTLEFFEVYRHHHKHRPLNRKQG